MQTSTKGNKPTEPMHTVQKCTCLSTATKGNILSLTLTRICPLLMSSFFHQSKTLSSLMGGGNGEVVNATRNPCLRNNSVTGGSEGYPAAGQAEDTFALVWWVTRKMPPSIIKHTWKNTNWYLVIQACG
eukprot:949264-Pelagomonas_calceolata.AAC.3